jgi:hypothetical protein
MTAGSRLRRISGSNDRHRPKPVHRKNKIRAGPTSVARWRLLAHRAMPPTGGVAVPNRSLRCLWTGRCKTLKRPRLPCSRSGQVGHYRSSTPARANASTGIARASDRAGGPQRRRERPRARGLKPNARRAQGAICKLPNCTTARPLGRLRHSSPYFARVQPAPHPGVCAVIRLTGPGGMVCDATSGCSP